MAITLQDRHLSEIVSPQELAGMAPLVQAANHLLQQQSGLGNDFLGWVDLPETYDHAEFARIQQAAKKITEDADILLVIGIGGSYLGARAAIELLCSPLYNQLPKETPQIHFVGHHLDPTYLNDLLTLCKGKRLCVNVISKSGTTTEPALAFRVFRELLEQQYGKEGAKQRIYATTDAAHGTLKQLADQEGYETFVIPDNVGGRFSVLTAVGLLPIAVAGCDIAAIMAGANAARLAYLTDDLEQNPCHKYAALRNILLRKGKTVELLVSYYPAFAMMAEWFKQLFGESEGKDQKGIFPAAATFSTDLHSLGQYVQDGNRFLFETVVDIRTPKSDFTVPKDPQNADGLNFLADQKMSQINRSALEGTVLAHTEGGTPNILLELDEIHETSFGELVYFFEKACAISGYLLGVNPFDQPGVEAYKKNMFALLGKPGYESQRRLLEQKLGR